MYFLKIKAKQDRDFLTVPLTFEILILKKFIKLLLMGKMAGLKMGYFIDSYEMVKIPLKHIKIYQYIYTA